VVTWRQAETRYPESGFSRSNRSRMAASTGMCRSAHPMRRTPSGANARSLTSKRLVVAIGLSLSSAAVFVREPHDVVELRRGDLEHEQVLDGLHLVNRARAEPEGVPRLDDACTDLPADVAKRELGSPLLHI